MPAGGLPERAHPFGVDVELRCMRADPPYGGLEVLHLGRVHELGSQPVVDPEPREPRARQGHAELVVPPPEAGVPPAAVDQDHTRMRPRGRREVRVELQGDAVVRREHDAVLDPHPGLGRRR